MPAKTAKKAPRKTAAAKKAPAKKAPVKKAAKKAVKKAAPKPAAAKKTYTFNKSKELFLRAAQVIPGAIYGHQSPVLTVPGSYPYYAVKAKGPYYWDADGNKFIDYMCGYGPMITGYNNPIVDAAARKEQANGDCYNHPTGKMVELAEFMVDLVPFADWAVFAKNGSDVTTWATLVAREATGRKKIVMCNGEYHGAHAWCTPGHGGLIDEDRAQMLYYKWNDLAGLRALFDRYPDQIAGVIMTPFHHPTFADMEMPAPGFWQGVQKLCNDKGAVLIIDDVRCGFRLSVKGSQDYFGFEPDISCYCKAIANGYTLSAAVGRDSLKNAAANVFLTGSYWNGAVPMAAALANIKLLQKENGIAHMFKMGEMLMSGLIERGKAFGYEMIASGPASIPYIHFGNETNFMRMQTWSAEMTVRGHFCHPHHNWFISTAHREKDIRATLNTAEEAFKIVKKEYGD